ncbi:MAG: complex I NDUFA9 subunit family protein [Phycisphaerales bacterium]
MRVAVTGATGFVGRHLCRVMSDHGYLVRALVRDKEKTSGLPKSAEVVEGDIFDESSLDRLLEGADACAHLIGIIEEKPTQSITFERMHIQATGRILDACARSGIKRYLHMSALGSRPNAESDYHRTKYAAELLVRRSGLDWTIFRPSLIHGPDGEFTEMVANWARGRKAPFVFMPYFGTGAAGGGPKKKVQPVFVRDVALAFTRALMTEDAIHEVFPVGGPRSMTWPEMYEIIRDKVSPNSNWRKPRPIPIWYARGLASSAELLGFSAIVPFNTDQVIMAGEDSVCDTARLRYRLGIMPTPLDEALSQYASKL